MRYSEPPELPEDPVTFRRPPVGEVALAVQLDQPVVDLEVLAEFARRVRDEFPLREQHPPLPRLTEDFEVPPRGPAFQFELMTEFELPRSWFISSDQTRLLQVQADRIIYNWRRQEPSEEYPRYRPLRTRFSAQLRELWDVLESVGKRVPDIDFCEVTYVNPIQPTPAIAEGQERPFLGEIINYVRPWTSSGFLPQPEDSQIQARWRIPAADGTSPVGRLYATATPAFRPDGASIYVMTLASRLFPEKSDDMSGPWEALDTGREWIVKGFEQLTTEEMHQFWNSGNE